MTMAKNRPMADFKPIKDSHGRDIAPSLIRSAVKTGSQREQRRRTWNRIKREIGALPGRQRAGYAQQVDAMYETGLVLMWVMNIATGYAYTSLTELAATTNTLTFKDGHAGLGRMHRALKMFRALGYIEFNRPLLNPQSGGRDRTYITVKPALFALYGTRESVVIDKMKKTLQKEISRQKKASENGYGLPPETLDAMAQHETAAVLIGWWQWYRYTKAAFRRFAINVRRAGLHILLPEASSPVPITP
ncbi:hypothetical protein ACS6L6_21680 [Enterobacter asburiae]|uniref:hypothetical protein n=1 Tax=Enterobacter asburiae TaxID=61645 RepID=UPI003F425539